MPDATSESAERIEITIRVNGKLYHQQVEPRMLLVEFLREECDLTGTHVGCDTTYCGACTVLMNGLAVKSCTTFAVQADGAEITTVEGLEKEGKLHPEPGEKDIRKAIAGNTCRCTGYMNVFKAIQQAGRNMREV